ncbi:glutathione peroxidase [Mesonia sp. HuA40]|uniref:glutathione peroxidase n=1 Tax=Mesonia sp. HuA40 TaxID=2602761 RepID=UPI0011C85F91|nr:glutathione peroxidase [Mesonia sp. HuA40]TXK75358.1 glutathione peroxidase [Mesonia sp. HuA40]
MKNFIYACLALFTLTACGQQKKQYKDLKNMEKQSIYSYSVDDIYGETFNLSELKGKKVMLVNTASKCGYTPQYKDLQALYERFKDDNFVIIGFPANNFANQEPGSEEQIAQFCEANYGVTFPMMSKISVKGSDIHPVYKFLTQKELNGVMDSEVKWNFQKYLIDEEGYLVKMLPSSTLPTDESVVNWIEQS